MLSFVCVPTVIIVWMFKRNNNCKHINDDGVDDGDDDDCDCKDEDCDGSDNHKHYAVDNCADDNGNSDDGDDESVMTMFLACFYC